MSDEKTARMESAPNRVAVTRGTLLVLAGPDQGATAKLEQGKMLLGSDKAADLRLTDKTISKRHAELEASQGRFLIRDLGSTNGTFLNGSQVKEAYLTPGDLIALGACQLRFEPTVEEVHILPSKADHFGPLFGKSLPMRQIFGVLERVAPSDATLLIQGETGTGKDQVARAVHAAGPRAARPFVVFDCSAVSPELVGSELFGHAEGAFTGALKRRQGAFETAQGGSVFLDEIGELPLDIQPKLLRVLENREVRPLGVSTAVPVDVRVMAATHRDLPAMVRAGTFRQDLYYRLAVVRVELPPLRERRDDLPGLIEALLSGLKARKTLTPAAIAALAAQTWPGNVRELRNVLERSLALAPGDTIDARDLLLAPAATPLAEPAGDQTLEEAEAALIRKTLARTGGNQKEAARILGIHRGTLAEKLKKYGIR